MTSVPIAAAIILAACDPCAGTSTCRVPAHVSYTGHIVERSSGKSVPGTDITFVRTAGIELAHDTVRATSGGDGFFTLATDAKEAGTVLGTLHVSPPGRPAYDISNIEMHTTTTRGDGGDLGRIVSDPYIMYIAQLQNRIGGSDVGAYATVTFRRTGGIHIDPEVISTSADIFGRFFLDPKALEPGTVEGELTVSAPGFPRTYTQTLRIDTRYKDEAVHDVAVVNLGAALQWVGQVYRRGTEEPTAGVRVDFTRTGGIAVSPAVFTGTSNDIGYFPVSPTPGGEGEVVGDITVHSPGKWAPFTVHGIHIATHADDSVRFIGRFGYGAQAFGLVELRYRTTMTRTDTGVTAIFRPTGGVKAVTDSAVTRLRDPGFAVFKLGTDTTGVVSGSLEVRLGEPYGTEVIPLAKLPSAIDDSLRFAGTYIVGRWFPQIGAVVDSATWKAIPGARVTFTRDAGVNFTPNPYVAIPDQDGYFKLRPQPLADGETIGTLTFELPAPYPTVTVPNIHLKSSMDDTLRFIGTWFIGPKK